MGIISRITKELCDNSVRKPSQSEDVREFPVGEIPERRISNTILKELGAAVSSPFVSGGAFVAGNERVDAIESENEICDAVSIF